MSSNKVDIHDKDRIKEDDGWERYVIDAVTGIRHGSVEVVGYDGRIVQIERRTRAVKYVANYAILFRAQLSF
jgi:hypothetical protein